MGKLNVIIECSGNNYSAYIEILDGIVATRATIAEIKSKMPHAIDTYVDTCHEMNCEIPAELDGDYTLEFKTDVQSLLILYCGIFTKYRLGRLTGINQKQLWHYANGKSLPCRAQVQKIEEAIHHPRTELISVHP